MRTVYKQLLYLLLSAVTLIAGYAYLRYAYRVSDQTPFTQEIVLTILGVVATIFITALLLNKQSAVEIEKEQSIKFFELKSRTYERLLDLMEKMSLMDRFNDSELVHLQFITHRLAIVASAEVLEEYQNFLQVISRLSRDNSFSGDSEELNRALGQLTMRIRQDLLGGPPTEHYSTQLVRNLIARNSDAALYAHGSKRA